MDQEKENEIHAHVKEVCGECFRYPCGFIELLDYYGEGHEELANETLKQIEICVLHETHTPEKGEADRKD